MTRIKREFCFAICAAVLCACSKQADKETGYSISMSPTVREVKSGAGDDVVRTTDANLRERPMGVYGEYNAVSLEEPNGYNVFNTSGAQKVEYVTSGTIGKWTYSPVQNWQINRFYRFRAYHPYSGGAIEVNPSSDVDNLLLGYSVAGGSEDLLLGFKAVQATPEVIVQPVKFEFVHALSALRFEIAFKNDPEIEDDYYDHLMEFYMEGLVGTGTLHYTHTADSYTTPQIIWYALAYDTAMQFYKCTFASETDANKFVKINAAHDNATMVFGGTDHMVYAVPQTRQAADRPTRVIFRTAKGGDSYQVVTLPDINWQQGKIYTYTLLVDKSDVDVSITIKDWSQIQSNVNIYL